MREGGERGRERGSERKRGLETGERLVNTEFLKRKCKLKYKKVIPPSLMACTAESRNLVGEP